jgi:D-threo-aldose 1-dehydrogenase
MGYDGILECYRQGNELLGAYRANLVSVHDPDEYLAGASDAGEENRRYAEILDSYRALIELREQGDVDAVGVGSKDPHVIDRLHQSGVPLDWAMFANSYTIYSHPDWVLDLMERLSRSGVTVINSAVFHGGFLIGGEFFDYQPVTREERPELFAWRDEFLATCRKHNVSPAHACCEYGRSPGVVRSIALNTSKPERVADNVRYGTAQLPREFWQEMEELGLV